MKILELCPFSAGICGVWARVLEESKRLSDKGHEILIFSSNAIKGCDGIAPAKEQIGKLKIKRFSFRKLGGESFMNWDFEKQALEFMPDIIIAHNYRHLHTTKALKIAEKISKEGKECKVFLVTHAPFVEGNITRSLLAKIVVKFYDKFVGPWTINKFDKILAISHWEIPYLIKAGAKKEKIIYLPNGIPSDFFNLKKQTKEENKVLFLGRIAPKKKIETIIEAIPYLKDKNLIVEIVGPKEIEYFNSLRKLIEKLGLNGKVLFSPAIYDLKNKIAKIDSCKIFVLASRVEGMPQSLIEAMARKKIVIGSDSIAIRDLIKDKQNGYLFEFNNPKSLAEKINRSLENKSNKIIKNAYNSVRNFNWDKVIKKYLKLFNEK
jgi:glycosyltransferase involved in cell wall biosynthesis